MTDPRYTVEHIEKRYKRIFAYIDGEIEKAERLPEPERSMELTIKTSVRRFAECEHSKEIERARWGYFRIREADEYDRD